MGKIIFTTSYCFLLTYLLFFSQIAHASNFSSTYIRFDRITSNTKTTGLVCAKPATNAVENSIGVTFPSNFTVNSDLSTWTVSTSNLPIDATPWPGINTATSVSSQSVIFPSSDLNVGTLYCFNFTNQNALTTGQTGNITGIISTYTPTLSLIDQSLYAITIQNNDHVTLTATVPVNINDLRISQNTVPVGGSTLNKDEELTVTISYGSNLTATKPFYLEASCDSGLIEGSSSNYIDVFDYITGSASNADDGTPAAIDLQNKKITWDIPALSPSVNDHTVTYKLKVKSSLATTTRLSTAVRSQGRVDSTYTAEQVNNLFVLLSVPSPGPTATSTPVINNKTPSPTPTILPLAFLKIEMREITHTTAEIYLKISKSAYYTISYGTQPNLLTTKLTSLTSLDSDIIRLSNLEPNTKYYFKIRIFTNKGESATSDLYVFRTALQENLIQLSKKDTLILWHDTVLNTPEATRLTIPHSKPLTVILHLDSPKNISEIRMSFQNSNVLGISTENSPVPIGEVKLIEISEGNFSAQLASPEINGNYDLTLRIKDIYGGFATRKIPYLFNITDPLTFVNSSSNKPIENVDVTVSKLEKSSQIYVELFKNFSLANRTDENGQLNIVLPQGNYEIETHAIEFTDSREKLIINDSTADYPKLKLVSNNSLIAHIKYFLQTLNDGYAFVQKNLITFTSSHRIQDLSLFLLESVVLLTAFITLFIRLRLNLRNFFHPSRILDKSRFSSLTVTDETDKGIPGVEIFFLNSSDAIVYKTKSELNGKVYFTTKLFNRQNLPLHIITFCKGFYSKPIDLSSLNKHENLKITLKKDSSTRTVFEMLTQLFLIGLSDGLIILSLFLTIIVLRSQGLSNSLFFIVMCGLLVSLWAVHAKNSFK